MHVVCAFIRRSPTFNMGNNSAEVLDGNLSLFRKPEPVFKTKTVFNGDSRMRWESILFPCCLCGNTSHCSWKFASDWECHCVHFYLRLAILSFLACIVRRARTRRPLAAARFSSIRHAR